MALNVFGGAPGDVTSSSSGDVQGGVTLMVYTAAQGGQRVTELYDMSGSPLAGVVTSGTTGDDEGRVAFQASGQYQILFLDSGYGMRWALPAQEAFSAASTALSRSEAALTAAQEAQTIAAESGVKADLAKAEVDAKLGFDITKLAPQFVTQLRGDPNTVVQSFDRDPLTGDYYASQGLGDIGGTTSLVVHRCGADGRVISTCTFEGGGHGSTTAIENDGQNVWLWFRWTYDSSDSGYTNRMVRAKFRAGQTVKRDDADVLEVPDFSGDQLVNFAIDQAADRVGIRVAVGGGERFALYRLSDYKAGRNTPLAQIPPLTFDSNNPYQGHCTLDDHLYLSRGNADLGSTNTITRIHWVTGEQDVINVNRVGSSNGSFPGGRNENEGVCVWRAPGGTPSLLFGKAVGSYGYRQALVYAFNPPAGDVLGTEALRSVSNARLRGLSQVPGAANTRATLDVRFPFEFDTIPTVIATPATVAAAVLRDGGVGVSNESTTGFTLSVWRSDATATNVQWIADAS